MRWLHSVLSALRPTRPAPSLAPEDARSVAPLPRLTPPVCIIGDLHGRLDLLEQMLTHIAAQPDGPIARLVFVGDIIDRGPQSDAVLRRIMALTGDHPDRITCLMGNHERMLLDFLDDPETHGRRWIANGGAETLSSFGISPWGRTAMPALATALHNALGAQAVAWLRALPLTWQDATLAVSHAGADPDIPFEAQDPKRLLWGNSAQQGTTRSDGLWVAQGHIIVEKPQASANCIMLDTGAWRSGILSAAWIDKNALVFLAVPTG